MTTLARRNSSIHKVREFQLNKIRLEDEYEVIHVIQEGWRGRLLLVEHRRTRHEVVIKAIHKDSSSRLDFFREFHYNYYLSPHLNILNAYDVAFEAGDYYAFAQEYAPFGDLTTNMSDIGLGEINTKRISLQLASALDFMHSKDLVHRDINMDNILVFKSDFSHVKLCDFGATKKKGTLLKKRTVWLPYAPPEIVEAVQNEGFHADTSQDVWQLGVLIYVLLTGQLPWQKAEATDPNYSEYICWRKRRILRTPKRFTNFTSRFLRMTKRLLEPKAEKRASVKEVYKYMDDKWLLKLPRRDAGDVDGQSVCYSTFSMHSCPQEKDRILGALKAHGIETTVDRIAKRQRIHEWLERSLSSKNLGELEEPTKEECQESECRGRRRIRNLQKEENRSSLDETTMKQYQEFASMAVKLAHAKAARLVQDANHNTTQDSKVRIGQDVLQTGPAGLAARQQEVGEQNSRAQQQQLQQISTAGEDTGSRTKHVRPQPQQQQQISTAGEDTGSRTKHARPQQQQISIAGEAAGSRTKHVRPLQQQQQQQINTAAVDDTVNRTKNARPQQRPQPAVTTTGHSMEETRSSTTPQEPSSQWPREITPHRSSTRSSKRGARSGSGSPHVRNPVASPAEVVGSPLANRRSGGSVKSAKETRDAGMGDRGGRENSKSKETATREGITTVATGERGEKEGPPVEKPRESTREAAKSELNHKLGPSKDPQKADNTYELQRSKTDSYFVTGKTRSPPSTQTSLDSEASDTSLASVKPMALR